VALVTLYSKPVAIVPNAVPFLNRGSRASLQGGLYPSWLSKKAFPVFGFLPDQTDGPLKELGIQGPTGIHGSHE